MSKAELDKKDRILRNRLMVLLNIAVYLESLVDSEKFKTQTENCHS